MKANNLEYQITTILDGYCYLLVSYHMQGSIVLYRKEFFMIEGRQPELTIKFTERPDLPETGKKVTLEVSGEDGLIIKADLNRKTLKKHVEKMDSYPDWIGALSGKIASISPEGIIELEAAGVNVFEKKAK